MAEIFQFTVNDTVCTTEEDKPLLRYLRDDLHLHDPGGRRGGQGLHPDDAEGGREKHPDG